MSPVPTNLSKTPDSKLVIEWSDGSTRIYPFRELREKCPCATCREKRMAEETKPKELFPVLAPGEAAPLQIAAMKPVGNYAYAIDFSDGHNTGIYTFETLLELGQSDSETEAKAE